MLVEKCACRRSNLPILPCDCGACVWFLHSYHYNNCFWVVCDFISENPGIKFSFDEIAGMEKVPVQEVLQHFENALKKLREAAPKDLEPPE